MNEIYTIYGKKSSADILLISMWMLFAALSSITAAGVAIFGKMGLKGVDPTLATTLRGTIMALILLSFTAASGAWKGFSFSHFGQKDWIFLILASVSGALSWLFYFVALKTGDATRVAAIDRTSVILVILLAAVVLGESLTWRSAAGAALIALGAFLIVLR